MRKLSGSGLVLEPQVAAHADELYPLLSDGRLYTYIEDKGPVSEAALRERLARLESRESPDGSERWLNWVIRTAEGNAAGYVQATVATDGSAEIAYVVGTGFHRRGIGRVGCSLMLTELRETYDVRRATATLDHDNVASLGLLRALGFGFAGEDRGAHEVSYARDLAVTDKFADIV